MRDDVAWVVVDVLMAMCAMCAMRAMRPRFGDTHRGNTSSTGGGLPAATPSSAAQYRYLIKCASVFAFAFCVFMRHATPSSPAVLICRDMGHGT
jgi:hypothetical protein